MGYRAFLRWCIPGNRAFSLRPSIDPWFFLPSSCYGFCQGQGCAIVSYTGVVNLGRQMGYFGIGKYGIGYYVTLCILALGIMTLGIMS